MKKILFVSLLLFLTVGLMVGQGVMTVNAAVTLNESIIETNRQSLADSAESQNSLSSAEALPSESQQIDESTKTATAETSTKASITEKRSKESAPKDSKKSEQAKSTAPRADVTPPGTADGVHEPSWSGFWLVIPWLYGFTMQPQAEQYIVSGSNASLDVQTVGSIPVLPSRATITASKWTLQPDNTWVKGSNSTFTSPLSILGHHDTDISISGLAVGTHYYQMSVTYLLSTYYSKLAKVVITDQEYPATGISVQSETPVVFPNTRYTVTAGLTPSNSTSAVSWASSGVTYLPTTGRVVQFTPNDVTTVNTSTTQAGIPLTLTGSANGHSGSDQVLVGGLAAMEMTEEQATTAGFKWQVSGVDKLGTTVSESYKWRYQWVYYDGNDQQQSLAAETGVQNVSGNLAQLTDLNTINQLTISPTSSLIAKAVAATKAGKPFSVKLTLTTSNDGNDLVVPSNKAQLRITPRTGKLTLVTVPEFDFGMLPANQIYNGNDNQSTKPTTTDQLTISDTRSGTPDWQLSAKLTPLESSQNTLNESTLQLTGLPSGNKTLNDDNTAVALLDSSQASAASWPITGQLGLKAHPGMQLTRNEVFQGTITWQLVSSVPTA